MGDPVHKGAAYDDLLAVPDHLVAEIIDGQLHTSPRPAARHALVASVLGGDLSGPFHRGRGGPGGWWIIYEPELHLARDVLVPDIAGWRRERLPEWPDAPALELAPDWACEILSPRTARLDRTSKLPIYAREHVAHVWLIDPSQRTLEVYRLTDGHWLLLATHSDSDKVRAEPFDAIELELSAWWG